MSIASSSRHILKDLSLTIGRNNDSDILLRCPKVLSRSIAKAKLRSAQFSVDADRTKLRQSMQKYSTAAYNQAQHNATLMRETRRNEFQYTHSTSQNSKGEEEHHSEADPDEPPPKATIRERLRFLSRRYGWWALGVYLLASAVDFSLVFVSIHLLGADHIRELEDRFRKYVGMGKREMEDHEVAAWPVPVGTGALDDNDGHSNNNAEVARAAAQKVQNQVKPESSSSPSSSSSTIWTEAVLAYTIHKTLLLPFRVGVTAAITPSFVKYMVKLGWAKDNAAVQKAAHKVKLAREAAKAARTSKVKQ